MDLLPTTDYSLAAPLFGPLRYHLAIQAVLHGAAPGQLWVDDANHPAAALLIARQRYHLAGDPSSPRVRAALRDWLEQRLYQPLQASGGWGFLLTFAEGWQAALQSDILAEQETHLAWRQYYHLDLDFLPRAPELPDSMRLAEVNPELVAASHLKFHADLLEELTSERESVEDFLGRSFGVCLRNDNALLTWCLSEYNLDAACEVGIATLEPYRQRGLATLTGRAFLRQAYQSGVCHIGWDCWKDNVPSAATARKLGFRLAHEFPVLYCPLPSEPS